MSARVSEGGGNLFMWRGGMQEEVKKDPQKMLKTKKDTERSWRRGVILEVAVLLES